jgi:hypothetical protein
MHLRTATARLKKHGILGFHSFRRYRITRLRELGTPEDIVRYWVGHAGEGITDRYSKLAENVELRKQWALRARLGFDLDHLGKPGDPRPQNAKSSAKKSRRKDPKTEIAVKRSLIKRRKPTQPDVVAAPAEPKFVATNEDLPVEMFETPASAPTQEEIDAELARLAELRAILEGVN